MPGLDRDDALRPELDALRRLAEQDRQRPVEHDEDLLLRVLDVAPAAAVREAGATAGPATRRARRRS